jgi:hypothetical protein
MLLSPPLGFSSGRLIFLLSVLFLLAGCTSEPPSEPPLFELLPADSTGISFENTLEFSQDFNIFTYLNYYDGGGVAVGDLSGNGLPDIYFISNMGPNRLYENQGDFRFEDVTGQAGVAGSRAWSTGAATVDINGDGLLDLYVTNSGDGEDRRNELFINNGDGTFSERAAEYGLDDNGHSIMAYFFDYDGDGRPDMYVVNNKAEDSGNFDLSNNLREARHGPGGDRLYRNEGDTFRDVTEEAGIYSSIIAFGLSAAISDLNRDGRPDIFVANDFFERDYIYMNQGDGTFAEVGGEEERFRSMSAASMGSDIADLTNNGWPDMYVADMLPFDEKRVKTVTLFEGWERYQQKVEWDYGHQLTRNMLHFNEGGGRYREVGRLAGVQATDWSWAVLLADFNNSGFNDIFVTNGLLQDITNIDYLQDISAEETMRTVIQEEGVNYEELIRRIPSVPVRNVMFANRGQLFFEDVSERWGLGLPTFSSGAAWADFDGDGSLDLLVSEVDGAPLLYRNHAVERRPEHRWLQLELRGEAPNTQALGAQLEVWAGGQQWYREHYLQRGFQSSVEPGLHIGLGAITRLDSLRLRWPDGRITRMENVEVPARITLHQSEAESAAEAPQPPAPRLPGDARTAETPGLRFDDITPESGLEFEHRRFDFSDFSRDKLLFRMRSTEGPALCHGDVTGNGLDDVFVGGARDQAGRLFLQEAPGQFRAAQQELFDASASSENTACAFFDATGNGHADLYVVSGGNSHSSASRALGDQFYLNDGNGRLQATDQTLPSRRGFVSGSAVVAHDFTGNGHQDVFVGTRLRPFAVGLPVDSYLLEGDGQGNFSDVSQSVMPELESFGMVSDATMADLQGDGQPELIVVGEWMAPAVFEQQDDGRWQNISAELGLNGLTGWWNSISVGDVSGNGRPDIMLGNHGLNSVFQAKNEAPVRLWVGDMAQNGITEHILAQAGDDGGYYPLALRHDLVAEIPFLDERFPDYESYGGMSISELFTEEELSRMQLLEARELGSIMLWNESDADNLRLRPGRLPLRAQLAPVFTLAAADLSGNGRAEILSGGNLFEVKPQQGPYDSSDPALFFYDDGPQADSASKTNSERTEQQPVSTLKSAPGPAFPLPGAARALLLLPQPDGSHLLVAARNNETVRVFRVTEETR